MKAENFVMQMTEDGKPYAKALPEITEVFPTYNEDGTIKEYDLDAPSEPGYITISPEEYNRFVAAGILPKFM